MQVFRSNPIASFFPLLLAGFLAGMSYWLEITSRPPKTDNEGKLRSDPDYIVSKFNVRRFNADGELQHTLIADEMRHFPKDDSTRVIEPRMIYHRIPATYINAREALVDGKGEHVELIREVRVLRAGMNRKPATEFNSERLHTYPDDEIARSDMPVRIRQGNSQLTGDALQSNNTTAIHILEGNVQGTFYRGRAVPMASDPPPLHDGASSRLTDPTRSPAPPAMAQKKSQAALKPAAKPAPAKQVNSGKPPVKVQPQAKSPSRPKPPAKVNPKAKH